MGEDWQTSEAISRTSDILNWFGVRQKTLILWNLNSLMSLHRINWGRLSFVSTICTVSKYMKHRMWGYGVNPLVIPNGIPGPQLNSVEPPPVPRWQKLAHKSVPRHSFLFQISPL